ncbi:TraR/DksA family transcriptional regulator [Paraburkholderia sp. IMGN_8]|uniref:TraR/DksA family transcriptional regulator n=1 Tax=Paraburkholderia sp. IMGN_8 TaxID=3136564 RepID=UPI0031017940
MSGHQVTLSEEFIAQQRKRLEALRRELLGGKEDSLANERTAQEQHRDEAEEIEDEAQGIAQREVSRALRAVNDRRIRDIQRALQKIADGTYGLSDASGQPIPKARLEATPEAVLTVEEQRSRESG